ncbi:MAG TPA: hypothetical protein VFE32_15435 [Puia sp.]|jgi:predicted amidophosphoribosyltransferase|nr:hypothetical protein [Puia sp.]
MGLLTSKIKCGNTSFTHFYLCPYLPLAAGTDALSLSLIRFKQRVQPDLDAWIECSCQLLGSIPFSPDTIIIRPLRHDETTVRTDFPSALDLLGSSLAPHLGCRYFPALLSKSRATLPNKHLTREQRRSQLHDVYQLAPASPGPASHVPANPASAPKAAAPSSPGPVLPLPPPINPCTPFLLIDDILTTGATMRALIQILRHHYPACPIKVFTLTRAGYSGKIPAHAGTQALSDTGYHSISDSHAVSPAQNSSLETLKSLIIANTV